MDMPSNSNPNSVGFYVQALLVVLAIAVPEYFSGQFGPFINGLLTTIVFGAMAVITLISYFIYRFGTEMTPSNVKIDFGNASSDQASEFLASFEKEDGPRKFYFTKLRNVLYLTTLVGSVIVIIPMAINNSLIMIILTVSSAAMTTTGIHAALKSYRTALLNLTRKIEVI